MQLLPIALLTLAPSTPSGDWPQFNGPNHDRTVDASLAGESWSSTRPKELWRRRTNTGFSSFTIAEGRCYTLERRRVDGDTRETCVAFEVDTGKEVWATGLCRDEYQGGGDAGADGNKGGDGPRSTPSYSDGRLFVLDTHLGLHALDAETGAVQWSVDIAADHGGQDLKWGNAASPVLVDGLVIVAGGGEGETFLAFRQTTGEVAWKTGDELYTHSTPALAEIHGVEQVIFLVQSGLVSLKVSDGDELWRAEYPYRVSSAITPVVDGDRVYVSAGYNVGGGAFEIERKGAKQEAKLLWHTRNDRINHWSTPVAVDGKLYGLYGFKKYGTAPLSCVDMETGELLWEEKGFGPGGLIRVGDELVVLGDAGQLVRVAIDPKEYKELGRLDALTGKCWSSPAYSDGRLYVRSTREGVCFEVGPGPGE